MKNIHRINGNIYITNDEEIKDGEYVVESTTSPRNPYIGKTFYPKNDGTVTDEILKKYLLSVNYKGHYETFADKYTCKKIILTTDTDLIKDGVQVIDDEFLEWICKNPSCEYVETVNVPYFDESGYSYLLIVPKEEPKTFKQMDKLTEVDWNKFKKSPFHSKKEPKQETLEKATKKYSSNGSWQCPISFQAGAKWQQEQNKNLYSEEEVLELLNDYDKHIQENFDMSKTILSPKQFFEQFKKK